MNLKTKQGLAILFSIGGAVGTAGTVLLARKAAMKEQKMRTANGCIYSEFYKMDKKERYAALLKLYLPTIVIGTATIGSIIGSTVMSHKAQASIMSMAVLADQGWRKYKHQVKSTLGIDTHENVLRGIAKSKIIPKEYTDDANDSRELYFEEVIGYFKAKPEDVAFAYAEINEMLNTDYRNQIVDVFDFVTLGTFVKLANAELIDKEVTNDILNSWGWTMDYLVEQYRWCWIHMDLVHERTDDGVVPFKVLSWIEDPIFLDRDVIGSERLSLEGLDVEEIDEVLDKKYKIQEKAYGRKHE